MKIVPDTSVLISGKISEMIKKGEIKKANIIIPKAVIDELQAQASRGREIGFEGLEEIKKIREIGKKGIKIKFTGRRPTLEEIQLAKKGRIDALIRDVAVKEKAILFTSDYVQALVGEAEGAKVKYIPVETPEIKLKLEDFFDKNTQSVHLKVGVPPLAKKGKPGNIKLVKIRDEPCTENELRSIVNQIFSSVRSDESSFIEIEEHDASVIQLGNYRISIARPPFSDALEITAVRPIAKVDLNDYKLKDELKERLKNISQGILISGPPGAGKSTFAAALAEFLEKQGNIVKTFEQPRDLQVGPEITQYAPLNGNWEKTADMLLLVRPDYTIFDELRKTKDFKVFADMRLAGVGMVGVVHATDPVNAIQRFIGRLELGMIPHVIDTIIYIRDGWIEKVYELSLTVKVPWGMKEEDLARPVIEIKDFETKRTEYEIYTYGEENVIIPVGEETKSSIQKLAKEKIYEEFKKWDPGAEVEIMGSDRALVKIKSDAIAHIIGKKGKNIEKIEEKLGIHLSIEPKEKTLKQEINFDFEEKGKTLILRINQKFVGKEVNVYKKDEFLFSAIVGKSGQIRIKKKSELGRKVLQAIISKNLRILV